MVIFTKKFGTLDPPPTHSLGQSKKTDFSWTLSLIFTIDQQQARGIPHYQSGAGEGERPSVEEESDDDNCLRGSFAWAGVGDGGCLWLWGRGSTTRRAVWYCSLTIKVVITYRPLSIVTNSITYCMYILKYFVVESKVTYFSVKINSLFMLGI